MACHGPMSRVCTLHKLSGRSKPRLNAASATPGRQLLIASSERSQTHLSIQVSHQACHMLPSLSSTFRPPLLLFSSSTSITGYELHLLNRKKVVYHSSQSDIICTFSECVGCGQLLQLLLWETTDTRWTAWTVWTVFAAMVSWCWCHGVGKWCPICPRY